MSKIVPLNGCVILKPVETQEETYGNIVLPDLGKERPEMGEVVAVSDTYNYHKGEYIQSNLSEGDNVLIPKMGTQKIVLDGEDYFIVKETDILAIVKK
jgi:chaperonin GroES